MNKTYTSPARKKAREKGFRSSLEMQVAEKFKKARIDFEYEPQDRKLEYIVKENACCQACGSTDVYSKHEYIIDFLLKDKFVVEAKGVLDAPTRKKMLAVKANNPNYVYIFVFQNNTKKISKRVNYDDWAKLNGFYSFSIKDNFEKEIKRIIL